MMTYTNRQRMFAIDATPGLRVGLFGIGVYVRANIPIVTVRDPTNREISRTVAAHAGVDYGF